MVGRHVKGVGGGVGAFSSKVVVLKFSKTNLANLELFQYYSSWVAGRAAGWLVALLTENKANSAQLS